LTAPISHLVKKTEGLSKKNLPILSKKNQVFFDNLRFVKNRRFLKKGFQKREKRIEGF
jgi:hypothetical protein